MIFFGHLGITTAAFKAYEAGTRKTCGKKVDIDYRFVLIGSVLPDMIDKPIGMFFFRSTFHNSRLFAHTLLFALLLTVMGAALHKKRTGNAFLLLGASSFIHLILDSMWDYPKTLFWPFIGEKVKSVQKLGLLRAILYSRAFPTRPEGNWIAEDFRHLLSDPVYMGAEVIGFAVLFFLFARVVHRKQLKAFFIRGKL